MIKVLKALRSNSGLTLMELLVAALLFAIIAATAMMVISPIMLAFSRANSLAEYNTVLDSVGNVIVSELAGARPGTEDDLDYGEELLSFITGTGSRVTFTVDDVYGILMRCVCPDPEESGCSGSRVFPLGFYGGKTISFNVPPPNDGVFVVAVTVHPSDAPGSAFSEITRDFAVRPLMLG